VFRWCFNRIPANAIDDLLPLAGNRCCLHETVLKCTHEHACRD
jgi:hypothetical protein